MNEAKFLIPAHKDLIVRDCVSRTPLSREGEWKNWSGRAGTYWRRRVRDGSVKIINPPRKTKEIKIIEKKGGR